MSIFDTISSSIGSLFDEGAKYLSDKPITDIIGGAVKGLDAMKTAKEKTNSTERDLYGFLQRNASMQDTDLENRFKATPTKALASVDPLVVERQWQAFLTGVADNKTVPGKRYSELN